MSRTRLRIVSGSAGGLLLKSPKKHELRPTQDRIRQVVFSSLGERVVAARVLDLFAGTGAYGLEALSRGAASATFVEQNGEAAQCIRDNLTHCHFVGDVRQKEVAAFLARPELPKYDLIFADPPYRKSRESLDFEGLLQSLKEIITITGLLIWEYYSEQHVPILTDWEITRHRVYGETALLFLRLKFS